MSTAGVTTMWPPPSGAVPPDASVGEFGFDFSRFGVRVPTVIVSPLIAEGTVLSAAATVPFDHTSILKTVETRWQLPALTARDAAAPGIAAVLTLTEPRTDDPLASVNVPLSTGTNPSAGTPSHIQEVHAKLVSQLPVPASAVFEPASVNYLATELDYDDYIRSRTLAWQASRGGE